MEEEQSKEKKKSHEKDSSKSLSELEKYWQVVRDNPSDFAGWTYLLHYVEQENNIEAAREAFRTFFEHYPYCYGYWKKFADMEKTLNQADAAEKVFEEGTQSIPLSVDLWIHFLNFYKTLLHGKEDCYKKVKVLFKKALEAAGREFRSDRLWDLYVNWEEENNNLKEVTVAYDTLLTIPTQLYSHHFEKFRKHVKKNSPREILSTDEFLELRQQVVVATKSAEDPLLEEDDDEKESIEKVEGAEALPPGVDSLDDGPPGLETTAKVDKDMMSDEQIDLMKKKIIEKRKAMHEKNEVEVGKRWSFEEGIKRPYFHVKPLERAQLKNWKDYLDYEIENGTHNEAVILFERCMIACALYEDMWLKYAKYMEQNDHDSAGKVYERACKIHLPRKPSIHFSWATYEEKRGNTEKSSEIIQSLGENIPDMLEVMIRGINLERRLGNYEKVEELYTKCISGAKSPRMASFFSVKFARYFYKIKGDFEKASELLKEALLRDPANPNILMQLVDVGYQSNPIDVASIAEAFDSALTSDMLDSQKILFSQRKLEFLEDFASDSQCIQEAYEEHTKRLRSHLISRKRALEEIEEAEKEKKIKTEVNGVTAAVAVTTATTTTAVATTAATTVPVQDSTAYQYQQSPWAGYQQNSYNYQQSWQYPTSYYSSH